MISNRQQHIPITELMGRLNLHLPGWKNYYGKRHCGMAMQRKAGGEPHSLAEFIEVGRTTLSARASPEEMNRIRQAKKG